LFALAALMPVWAYLATGHADAPSRVAPRTVTTSTTDTALPVSEDGSSEYVIQLQPGTAQQAAATRSLDAEGIETTDIAVNLPISVATLTPEEAADVATMPGVLAISPNSEIHAADTQPSPQWNLDRIDQTDLPFDGGFTYPASAGANTTIYILDSGINATHTEFTARIQPGVNTVPDLFGNVDPNATNDLYGHGTHVAGTAAGTLFGVAKMASIVPVRVLDDTGSGTTATVINGIDWVLSHHVAHSVANLSLGGNGPIPIVDNAIAALVADGVAVAVAAGNSGADSCLSSPARARAALTVGASTELDSRASFSNIGSCIDLFAPGSNIVAAWIGSPTATALENGTSMATPHVAGALALLWTEQPGLTSVQVQQLLVDNATPNRLSDVGLCSPNLLLHIGPAAASPLTTVTAPASANAPAVRCFSGP
jgi:subtilisin family serine protease